MNHFGFLEGGGEMGERTRGFDWSRTPVGTPGEWPRSLRTIVSAILLSRHPMFLWWGKDLIQFYNDAYRPSLGDTGKHPAALGQKGEECWPEIWDIIHPLIHQVLTTGVSTWSEDQLVPIFRNGAIQDVYWTFGYSPVRDDEDKINGVLVICTETTQKVTYLNERTRELAEANRNLERSNAELSQFAYIASHDLQEPVRKVGIYADILREHVTADEPGNYLKKIITASERMQALIRDILAYSEVSKQSPAFEPVDLQAVVHGVMSEFDLLIEQTGARITCTDLPVIDAIPLQMVQLFGNLLSNALKYIKAGIKPVITITTTIEGANYHFEVRDNGIGFDQQYAGQIFSIFKRLHRKAQYSGTGIGLALCKKIVENHHGQIFATSSPGEGANFHIILPRT